MKICMSPNKMAKICRHENSLIFALKALNTGFHVTVSSPAGFQLAVHLRNLLTDTQPPTQTNMCTIGHKYRNKELLLFEKCFL